MDRLKFFKSLGLLAGGFLIPSWVKSDEQKNPTIKQGAFNKESCSVEEINGTTEVMYVCITDEKDMRTIEINGKFYEKIHIDDLTLEKANYYHNVSINKNHKHNKDIDFEAFWDKKDECATRSYEFWTSIGIKVSPPKLCWRNK